VSRSIDILIPCKDESLYLPSLFEAIRNLKIPVDLSVRFLFSDNNSSDSTVGMLKELELEGKILFLHEQDVGTRNNLLFLLSKVESEFFMFVDAHDYFTSNYLSDFYEELNSSNDFNRAFVGKIISLNEVDSKFIPTDIQDNHNFSRFSKIRVLQLVLFLFHNSIYHAIFPTQHVNRNSLASSQAFTLDHLITHSGIGKCNLKYLESSYYVRRYREIVGPDFTHYVNGEKVTRYQRAVANNDVYTDKLINHDVKNLIRENHGKILSSLSFWLISGKHTSNVYLKVIYRLTRFVFNKILFLNPIKIDSSMIPHEILEEISIYENYDR
jgi:hypothetical protein